MGEQESPVEAGLDERLRAQPLRDRRRRLPLRGAAGHQRDGPRDERRNEERDRNGQQRAQPPVGAGEGRPALLEELVLEAVQPRLLAGTGPLERRREPRAAIELARFSSRRLPLGRRFCQMEVKPAALRVLLEPRPEPRPLLEERFVHELDGPVVGHEQPPFDEHRQHARDALVVVGIEFGERDTPPRERVAVTAGNEAQHDASCDRLVVIAQRAKRGLRVSTHRAPDSAAARTQRQSACSRRDPAKGRAAPSASAEARPPRLRRRRRAHRRAQAPPRAPSARRAFDRAAELARAHRPEQDVVRSDEVGQLDIRREVAEEVRAQRDQYHRAALRVPRGFDERLDEPAPLLLADRRREQLLELVDRENRHLADRWQRVAGPHERVRTSERRKQARPEEGRLAASGRAHDRKQWCVLEPAEDLVDEALAAEEELLRPPPRTGRAP